MMGSHDLMRAPGERERSQDETGSNRLECGRKLGHTDLIMFETRSNRHEYGMKLGQI